ncbi:MAG TPA: hypothetical protein VHZ95_00995 [Polyangiales bacterium]|nr:hypothetical protein [Polyangiales bacterium]
MKRGLPTVSGAPSRDHAIPLAERRALERPVIAIAHLNQLAAASRLAVQLCAALVREQASVAALVTIDNPAGAQEAESALSRMLEAGVRQAVMVRKPERDVSTALTRALDQMTDISWIVALGNALPQLFKPYFTVVVTGHRRTLTGAEPLILQAELEVTAPGEELATLLARRLIDAR